MDSEIIALRGHVSVSATFQGRMSDVEMNFYKLLSLHRKCDKNNEVKIYALQSFASASPTLDACQVEVSMREEFSNLRRICVVITM